MDKYGDAAHFFIWFRKIIFFYNCLTYLNLFSFLDNHGFTLAYFRGSGALNRDIIISSPAPPPILYTSVASVEKPSVEKPIVRKLFPETWIWDEINMNG